MPLSASDQHPTRLRKAARGLSGLVAIVLSVTALAIGWHNRDLFLPGRDLDEIRKSGKLKVLLAYDPINYFIYKGAPMGYSYELAERFADELGVKLEVIVVRDLNQQIPLLRDGTGDLIAHSMTVTDSRAKTIRFSLPFDYTRQVLIQHASGIPGDSSSLVRALRQLDGKTVYVREKSAYYNNLVELRKRYGISINIVQVHGSLSTGELIKQVNNGMIDFTVADSNIAVPHQVHYPGVDISTVISPSQPLAWAVRKNSPELHRAMNRWIEREQRSGLLRVLHNKYFEKQYHFREHVFNAFYSDRPGGISPYDDLVKSGALSIGWDWRLLSSLIYEESQFDPGVVSWAGATGLMQLMPRTASISGISNLSDPAANIKAGTAYLVALEKEWQKIINPETRLKFILASYNVGPGHVRDAQKLAVKYGADPNRWEDNVERYLTLKSEPRYYNDAATDFGYCNGALPVRYTRNILNRYQLYMQVFPQ
ncbi:MAG: transporter substrate-binding domain-containing protein [Chlorobiaceae bacterium]|nr:transporter substrate-binding domain-containing protein [Chlorobiaceae bacterium]NTW74876.1 transporter substrate-binding domain-containing protein [Chlorobiaceae bacterium]